VLAVNATTEDSNSALSFTNDYAEAIWFSDFSKTCDTPEDLYGCSVKTVAKALTKSIRDAPFLDQGRNTIELISGTVFVTTTFVRIHWGYLPLHLVVWIFSAITWVVAVVLSLKREIPFWMGSELPLVFLYGDGVGVGGVDRVGDWNGIERLEERAG